MIKINEENEDTRDIICMAEMEPLQVGKLVRAPGDISSGCVPEGMEGNIVMRTATEGQVEVMDLTNSGAGNCWFNIPIDGIKVELLPIGEIVKLEIFN